MPRTYVKWQVEHVGNNPCETELKDALAEDGWTSPGKNGVWQRPCPVCKGTQMANQVEVKR